MARCQGFGLLGGLEVADHFQGRATVFAHSAFLQRIPYAFEDGSERGGELFGLTFADFDPSHEAHGAALVRMVRT